MSDTTFSTRISTMKIPSLPPGVTLTTLENGLTIIVREDHSAPVVSAQAWCHTGSVNEGKWLGAGLSLLGWPLYRVLSRLRRSGRSAETGSIDGHPTEVERALQLTQL